MLSRPPSSFTIPVFPPHFNSRNSCRFSTFYIFIAKCVLLISMYRLCMHIFRSDSGNVEMLHLKSFALNEKSRIYMLLVVTRRSNEVPTIRVSLFGSHHLTLPMFYYDQWKSSIFSWSVQKNGSFIEACISSIKENS